MKVFEVLKKVGAKAGLLQVQEETTQEIEIKIVERKIISLAQLQDASESAEELASPSPELAIGFNQVYEALNLTVPEHGWTAERVAELMNSDELKSKTPQEAAQSILATLGQNQVKPDDILKDALARDKALDSYGDFVEKKIQQRAGERKKIAEKLLEQARLLNEEAKSLEKAQATDEKKLHEWKAQKMQREEELARVASLFVQDHGISVGNNKNHK